MKAYSGPADALRKISAEYGIRGVMRGHGATMLREGIGGAGYYGIYEWLKEKYYPVGPDGS